MKIFNILTASLASASRLQRATREITYGFTGDESPEELTAILDQITGGTFDEIDDMIRNLMGTSESRMANPEEERKFRQMKILVLWLQNSKKFGRYCFYGCYCLPEGSHNIAAGGYGKPQDSIDKACFDFKQCYRCLNAEFAEMKPHKTWAGGSVTKCAGELLGYRFDLIGAPEDPDRDIVCTNKPGSCRRSICECDKALAKSLAKQEETWNEALHELKGGFDRDQHCHRPTGPAVPFVECCGDTSTFPFNKPRRENQCCSGTEALPEGTC